MGGSLPSTTSRTSTCPPSPALSLLAAPFLATGLYALSRDREAGRKPRLVPSLTAWRENMGGLGIYVLVITVIFLVWARASLVTFALFSTGRDADLKGFLAKAFSLGNIEFVLVYFAAGSVFATLVFAVSVVSVPMMLDRGNDAVSAAILSVQVLAKEPGNDGRLGGGHRAAHRDRFRHRLRGTRAYHARDRARHLACVPRLRGVGRGGF